MLGTATSVSSLPFAASTPTTLHANQLVTSGGVITFLSLSRADFFVRAAAVTLADGARIVDVATEGNTSSRFWLLVDALPGGAHVIPATVGSGAIEVGSPLRVTAGEARAGAISFGNGAVVTSSLQVPSRAVRLDVFGPAFNIDPPTHLHTVRLLSISPSVPHGLVVGNTELGVTAFVAPGADDSAIDVVGLGGCTAFP